MPEITETRKTGPMYRSFALDRAAINADARTVELSFSSESPYERWFGTEILDHAPTSIRLDRLKDGGAVLLDHDPTEHVGVVEQVSIGSDRVGRAVVRFGRSARAEEAWKDVQDGIRRHVSVGYMVHRMVLQEETDDQEIYRVTDWEPYEVSMVAIPADPTVGVGRAAQQEVLTTVVRHVTDKPTPKKTEIIVMDQNETKATDPLAIERLRVASIIAMGEQYAKYLANGDAAQFVRDNRSVDQFREFIMGKMEARHTDTRDTEIGMSKREVQRYSFGRIVRAFAIGDMQSAAFELEASRAVAKLVGNDPEGFYVPFEVFRRDFNVGTSTEAGNLVATDLRTDLYTDALRNAIVFGSLGVRFLTGLTSSVAIPRKSTASTIGTLAEIGSASETNPNITQHTLSPKRIGAYIEVSKQAIITASMALEPMLRDDLLIGAAVQIENGALNGAGTSNQMTGLRNQSGIGTVAAGANGAVPAWSHFVDLESACANANSEPDRLSGYVINTRTRGKLKQTTKATNLPFIWDNGGFPLNGYRAAITNNLLNNLTKGTSTTCSAALFGSDWSMAVIGLFGAPDIVVDPYSKADTGQVKITLNQFADFCIRQPGAFAKIEDLLSN